MECLESTFLVFLSNLNVVTHQSGLYNKLKYFYAKHYEDEANYASGNGLKNQKSTQGAHFHDIN